MGKNPGNSIFLLVAILFSFCKKQKVIRKSRVQRHEGLKQRTDWFIQTRAPGKSGGKSNFRGLVFSFKSDNSFQISNHRARGENGEHVVFSLFLKIAFKVPVIKNLDKDSSRPIPDHWMFVVEKKDGSSRSYYSCPESGQMFNTYEDLMRYVNYAKGSELSIYSPDFKPRKLPCRQKKKASTPDSEETEKSTDSEDSTFKLPAIATLDFLDVDVTSLAMSNKQSVSDKAKFDKSRGSNEGCSSNMGKAKKQKK